MILRIGSGSVRTSVGIARIWSPFANCGCSSRSIISNPVAARQVFLAYFGQIRERLHRPGRLAGDIQAQIIFRLAVAARVLLPLCTCLPGLRTRASFGCELNLAAASHFRSLRQGGYYAGRRLRLRRVSSSRSAASFSASSARICASAARSFPAQGQAAVFAFALQPGLPRRARGLPGPTAPNRSARRPGPRYASRNSTPFLVIRNSRS